MMYLGDLAEDQTVTFHWNTNDSDGASITRSTDGTIKVRRDDGTDCTGTSVTDTEDTPDTGIHECIIDTSDSANYAIGHDYTVWLDGAVIDTQTVNAALATFSIENRYAKVTELDGDATAMDNLVKQYKANWRKHDWYVAKTGNDSNGGHSLADAFLTIGQAITSASAGDTIEIYPGTYAENLNPAKALNFVGTDKYTCIIGPASGTGVVMASGCSFKHLQIKSGTGSSDKAVTASSKNCVTFEDCIVDGEKCGIDADTCEDWRIDDSKIIGGEHGGDLQITRLISNDTTFVTSGEIGDTPQVDASALFARGALQVYNRCNIHAKRTVEASSGGLKGVDAGTDAYLIFNECNIQASEENAGSAAGAYGGYTSHTSQTLFNKCNFYTSNAGSGAVLDLFQGTGTFVVVGGAYNKNKIYGTLIYESAEWADKVNAQADAALSDAGYTSARAGYLDELAAANLPTDISTIDTVVDGIATAVGALNDLSTADVNAEVDSAISDGLASIADAVWDEILSSGAHNTLFSAGKRLQNQVLRGGTAISGGANYIVFPGPWSSEDRIYEKNIISITDGTGAGQTRTIIEYIGEDRKAYVDHDWITQPDDTSEIELLPGSLELLATHGIAAAGSADTITFSATALAKVNSYIGCDVYIAGGTGIGQTRLITAYTAGRVATVSPAWDTQPDNTSVYKVIPIGRSIVDSLSTDAEAIIKTDVDTALSDIGLDHLVSAAVIGADITDNSIIAKIVSKSATADWDDFVNTTDSLQAIRDNQAGADAAAIADAVWDEAATGHTDAGKAGAQLWTDIDAVLADSNELQTDWHDGGRLDLLIDAALADTNELQTDWVNGGRLDNLLDAAAAGASTAATTGTVDDAAATTSSFITDLTEATNDHYNNLVLCFTSGVLTGQSRRISDYVGSTKTITVSPPFTDAPGNTDSFSIFYDSFLTYPTSGGINEVTYTLKYPDEDTGDPVPDAHIWITTDAAGNNVIWNGVTDANGVLKEAAGGSKPFLFAGTYYFWRSKSGYDFINPDTETFS